MSKYNIAFDPNTDYITVWLIKNTRLAKPRMFFCPSCQAPIMQYLGDVTQMMPGKAEVELPVIVQCRNKKCNNKYVFAGMVEREE